MCCCDYDSSDELREDARFAREQADRALRAATAAERDALDARAERDATHRQYLVIRDELERVRAQHERLASAARALLVSKENEIGGWMGSGVELGFDALAAELDTSEHRTGD